jgi:hypothetical protein
VKIRFTAVPPARDYKVGDIVEFKGHIDIGYAHKYINRGWAEEYVEPKPVEVVKPVEVAKPVEAKPVEVKPVLKLPTDK